MKNFHFTPNNYKEIVLKIRIKNTSFSAFTILLLRKSSKTSIFTPISIGNRTKNKGTKLPTFQFYDTFIVKNSHFIPNNYKGIILKTAVQNSSF